MDMWRIIGVMVPVLGVIALAVTAYDYGHSVGTTECQAETARQANDGWVQRSLLEAQLTTRDSQLAEAQQVASTVRTETIVKKEVVYRDRIKERVVYECVNDSGLFELYNATLGVTGGK